MTKWWLWASSVHKLYASLYFFGWNWELCLLTLSDHFHLGELKDTRWGLCKDQLFALLFMRSKQDFVLCQLSVLWWLLVFEEVNFGDLQGSTVWMLSFQRLLAKVVLENARQCVAASVHHLTTMEVQQRTSTRRTKSTLNRAWLRLVC